MSVIGLLVDSIDWSSAEVCMCLSHMCLRSLPRQLDGGSPLLNRVLGLSSARLRGILLALEGIPRFALQSCNGTNIQSRVGNHSKGASLGMNVTATAIRNSKVGTTDSTEEIILNYAGGEVELWRPEIYR